MTGNRNISFRRRSTTFASMNEQLKQVLKAMGNGETSVLERFFRRPGGRRYLEQLTLILIHTLPHHYGEKEDLYLGFVEVLDGVEQHLRQKEGDEVLERIFRES